VQRAFILADEVIEADLAPTTVAAPESASLLTVRVGSTLEEVSRRLIEATLAECGSKRKAADMLGISLKTLYNRLAAYKANEPVDGEEDDAPTKPAHEPHRRAA
jgi:DNA-binding NtrC family response regulator